MRPNAAADRLTAMVEPRVAVPIDVDPAAGPVPAIPAPKWREHRDAGPLAGDAQLIDRARPLQVTGHQQRCVALAA